MPEPGQAGCFPDRIQVTELPDLPSATTGGYLSDSIHNETCRGLQKRTAFTDPLRAGPPI